MTRTNLAGLTVLGALLLGAAGCSGLTEKPKPQTPPVAQEQKPAVLLDRYELREIRNGAFIGTALLDKQTGRVWTLGTTSKGGQVTSGSFVEVPVIPKPEAVSNKGKWNPVTGRYE